MTIQNYIPRFKYKIESEVGTIFFNDVTLRDGEQAPGCSMTIDQKIRIARSLCELGVDGIEAGFPANEDGGFQSVEAISREFGSEGPFISGLARAKHEDIDAVDKATKSAKNRGVHTFIATSPIHMEDKLKKTPSEVLEIARKMVGYAASIFERVQFSAEDAGRSDENFLFEVIEAAIDAGATIINIPDTVGFVMPFEYGGLIKSIVKNVPNINKAVISTHTHNDLGNAVANTIEGIRNGARQVEGTINGIGERAGNCDNGSIIATMRTRSELFREIFGRDPSDRSPLTNINHSKLYNVSNIVSQSTIPIPVNHPITGANAFAHESGIHQDGMSKNQSTYEIMYGSDYGVPENIPTFSANSGTAGFLKLAKHCGVEFLQDKVKLAYDKFSEFIVSVDEKSVSPFDFMHWYTTPEQTIHRWKIDHFEFSDSDTSPESSVSHSTMVLVDRITGISKIEYAQSENGQIDANVTVVNKILKIRPSNISFDFDVNPGNSGSGGEVIVKVTFEFNGKIYYGKSKDTSTDIAATEAYLDAINRIQVSNSEQNHTT